MFYGTWGENRANFCMVILKLNLFVDANCKLNYLIFKGLTSKSLNYDNSSGKQLCSGKLFKHTYKCMNEFLREFKHMLRVCAKCIKMTYA